MDVDRDNAVALLNVDDPAVRLRLGGDCNYAAEDKQLTATVDIDSLDLNTLRLTEHYPGYSLAANISLEASGSSIDNLQGQLGVDNLRFAGPDKQTGLEHLAAVA